MFRVQGLGFGGRSLGFSALCLCLAFTVELFGWPLPAASKMTLQFFSLELPLKGL